MKWCITFSLIALIACNNNNRPAVEPAVSIDTVSDFKSDFIEDEAYISPLPAGSSQDNTINEDNFMVVPDDMRSLFGQSENISDVCMVRFPDHKGYKVIAVSYTTPGGYESSNLYTFDSDWNRYDQLQVESIESLEPYSLLIVQEYEIDKDYRIIETKYLNDLIIEQLTYEITDQGNFAELRDGYQQVIAYEMFDGTDQFIVESFIWNLSPEGKLSKRDITQTTYDLKRFQE